MTIEIIVTADGNTVVYTKGFTGASCVDASRFLEQALGRATADRRTADFYHAADIQQQQQQQRS